MEASEQVPEASATEQPTSQRQDAPYYCPACGARASYQQKCVGKPEAPHPPQEVVSTDELGQDYNPDAKPGEAGYHTPAPSTENLG